MAIDDANDPYRQEFFQKYLHYLDGLILFSEAECPKTEKQSIKMGWDIGRQMISQYVVEMLIRIRLERQGITRRTGTHNLALLYRKLTEEDRKTVESVYKRILNAEVEWTWDVYETVESFLKFIGKNPIVATRYPWQQKSGTLYSPASYRSLIYALFIALHQYPFEKSSLDKRFETKFKSFSDSRKRRHPRTARNAGQDTG